MHAVFPHTALRLVFVQQGYHLARRDASDELHAVGDEIVCPQVACEGSAGLASQARQYSGTGVEIFE